VSCNFVSWKRFHEDIEEWERELPEFDAVCGIPRSGLPVAAYIALRRNIRLVSYESLLADPINCIRNAPIRNLNPVVYYDKPFGNRLLIVDDATGVEGVTISELKSKLSGFLNLSVSFGAVYAASETPVVDFSFRYLPQPRFFAWNWFRHWSLQSAYLDMDGVICEDWTSRPEQENDEIFSSHIDTVPPLYVPEVPVAGIVTSRLELYRGKTEAWLAKHNVQYGELVMHPAKTPQERRDAGDHAARKAEVFINDPSSRLFVESDVRQAKEIHRLSQKPVLCLDTMEMFS
jgi:uncharacterized HAD superfamily protein